MPTYEFTSPDGKTYEVSGPGSSQEAFAILQGQLGGAAKPAEQEGVLGRAHREGSEALQGALSQIGGVGSGKAEDYLGPSGMLRSAKETGSALLGAIGAIPAYPMAALSSLGAAGAGPALRGAESGIAAGVGQVAPEYAERLRANIPSEEQAYEATKPGIEAALSAVGGRQPKLPPIVPPPTAAVVPGTRAAVMEAAARRDIDLPRFYGSDNPITQMTGMGLSNFPVLGTPAIRSTEKLLTNLGKGVSEVATAQGGASMEGAGSTAQRSLLEWIGPKTKGALDEAYGAAEKAIDPNIRHASPETQALLDELVARRENAGLKIPQDLKDIQRAIKGPKVESADDTFALLEQQLGREAAEKTAKRMGIEIPDETPAGLNFEGAKTLRTHVREMQGSQRQNIKAGDLGDTELKRLEGALGDDLRSIVDKAGSKTGSALFERANTLAAKVSQDRDILIDIVGLKQDAAPAQVFDRLKAAAGGKSRADTEKLLRAKNAIGDDWDQVVSGITAQLGKDTKGDFSALKFVKDYEDLSDAGKSVLFGGAKGAHRQALDDINELSRRFNKVQKFQNYSGTARSVAVIGAFTTPIVALGKLFDPSIMAGVALTRFTAGRLAKPIDLSDVLSKPTTAAAGAAWARAFERAQLTGSTAGIANLGLKARDLANNINSEFGTKVSPDDLMPKP